MKLTGREGGIEREGGIFGKVKTELVVSIFRAVEQ